MSAMESLEKSIEEKRYFEGLEGLMGNKFIYYYKGVRGKVLFFI